METLNNLFDKMILVNKLPKGHIDKKKIQDALNKVYENSKLIERKWSKRFGKHEPVLYNNEHEVLILCNKICDALGQKRLKAVVFNSNEVHPCAGAHYCKREIHSPHSFIMFSSLMHELAHHFAPHHDHGEEYCWTLDFLYRFFYEQIIGKKLHSDWD